jgi:hypothetical protein
MLLSCPPASACLGLSPFCPLCLSLLPLPNYYLNSPIHILVQLASSPRETETKTEAELEAEYIYNIYIILYIYIYNIYRGREMYKPVPKDEQPSRHIAA